VVVLGPIRAEEANVAPRCAWKKCAPPLALAGAGHTRSVQIQAVNALTIQGDLLIQDGRDRVCDAHRGLWLLGALLSQPSALWSIRRRSTALPSPCSRNQRPSPLQLVGLRRSLASVVSERLLCRRAHGLGPPASLPA